MHKSLLILLICATTAFCFSIPNFRGEDGHGMRRRLLEINSNANWLHNLPRKTLSGKATPATLFLASDADYYSCLGSMLAFLISAGAVAIIAAISFTLFRFCFNMCGGKKPTRNYTVREKRILKISLGILSLVILIVMALGLMGNTAFDKAINIMTTSIQDRSVVVQNIVESVEPRLNQVNANRTAFKGFVPALTRDGPIIAENAARGKKYIGDNDLFRLLILGFNDAFIFLAIIFAVVSASLNKRVLSMVAAYLGFFSIFMCYFNTSVNLALSVVVADLCHDTLEYGLEQRIIDRDDSRGNNYGGLENLIHCPSWSNSNRTYFWALDLREDATRQIAETNSTTLRTKLRRDIEILDDVAADCIYLRQCRWILDALRPLSDTTICTHQM
eukprot:TRINITY_DN1852_c0_g1_i2.p1 TRINITY_DN1852_c0_g1~~TRINITY_DN1852_c0_g1_i2.p1  ORF type:complete len:389 (-),score=77.23 TRINITY_DN1852_c0_g1_i2:215-1381(-)